MFRIQSVRWPAPFLTSARNFPSPDKATFSSVPVLVIWLKEIEVNGTARGQRRQAAKPATGSSSAPNAMATIGVFFAAGGAIPGTLTGLEPGDRTSEAPFTLPLGGAGGGVTRPLPELLGLEPTLVPPTMLDGLAEDPPLLLRCSRFRSARNSAAGWQRSSRSFSSVLLRVSSNSTGSSGWRE